MSFLSRGGAAITMVLAVLLTGCQASGRGDRPATPVRVDPSVSALPEVRGTITVLAAASLTEAFTQIGADFEALNPSASVILSFGSSATLASQITQGAPADVFAAANETTMAKVTAAGVASEPVVFATNTLEIAVPAGNPAKVTGLADFANPDLRIALCAPEVPCGAAAATVFAAAGITPRPDTLEADVKATLQKVRLGEVDAGLIYTTDVIAAGDDIAGIEFDEATEAATSYPIATLTDAGEPEAAAQFVAYVRSPQGQAVLAAAGFAAPR